MDFRVSWASSVEDIEQVQKFRYRVFCEEYTPKFPQAEQGLDVDVFDAHCDHLLLTDHRSNQIVGSYRVIPPSVAQRIGHLYCESLFDLSPLAHIRHSIVEIDRSCIDKPYRNGSTILLMWKMIFAYVQQHKFEYIMGCSSQSIDDGGQAVFALNERLKKHHHFSSEFEIKALKPVELDASQGTKRVAIPPILKGYLNLGAKVCSEPAYDALFNTADYLTLLRVSEMKTNYLNRFQRAASPLSQTHTAQH